MVIININIQLGEDDPQTMNIPAEVNLYPEVYRIYAIIICTILSSKINKQHSVSLNSTISLITGNTCAHALGCNFFSEMFN